MRPSLPRRRPTARRSRRNTALSFPSNTTCGRGNAQVVAGTSSGGWRIFFNGHAKSDPPHGTGPKLLYVAEIVWSKSGRPKVSRFV